MNDIVVGKAANYMDDSFNLADVTKEFVSQTFTFGCSLYQTCDVAELDGGIDSTLALYIS